MLLDALLLVLSVLMARAFWRLLDGVIEGLSGRPRRDNVPARGVQMVRDPVCGIYIVPQRALVLQDGARQVFFCSANCRDKYRARTA